jgi:hypothetical protein
MQYPGYLKPVAKWGCPFVLVLLLILVLDSAVTSTERSI